VQHPQSTCATTYTAVGRGPRCEQPISRFLMSSRMPDAGSMCSGQPGATADSSSMPSNTPTREPARVGMHAEIRDTGGAVGRGLFATRALGPGTLIAVEKPYVWKLPLTTTSSSAESSDRSGFCHQCLAPSVQLKRCGACKGPMYCSTPCQKAAWRGHKVECAAIQRVAPHIPPSALMLMASVLQTGDGVVAAQIAGLKGSADDLDVKAPFQTASCLPPSPSCFLLGSVFFSDVRRITRPLYMIQPHPVPSLTPRPILVSEHGEGGNHGIDRNAQAVPSRG
jgi:hypothetical protein